MRIGIETFLTDCDEGCECERCFKLVQLIGSGLVTGRYFLRPETLDKVSSYQRWQLKSFRIILQKMLKLNN